MLQIQFDQGSYKGRLLGLKGKMRRAFVKLFRKETPVIKRAIIVAAILVAVAGIAGQVGAQSGGSSPERFVLTGVVYVEGGRGIAWLQEPTFTNNQIKTLRVGDRVGPYRLTKILEDQVELEGPNGKVAVPLAGSGGAISVAAIPPSPETPAPANVEPANHELPPHPALNNPDAIVVLRGDPRRNFPTSDLMIGGGATLGGFGGGRQAAPSQAVLAPSPAAVNRGVVPAAMQTPPPQIPAPVLQNPNATVVPRGDPSRNFPASTLLIGAGAQAGGGTK